MSIVGHRGSSYTAPENTLASMRLAVEHGAQGVEFDIQRSKDGHVFLLHDDTLRRTASAIVPKQLRDDGLISQSEYERVLDEDIAGLSYQGLIRHVDVGSWKKNEFRGQHPPLMIDVMAQLPDATFALCEVKGGDLETARAVVSLVAEYGWKPDKLRFIGFDLDLLVELKGLLEQKVSGKFHVYLIKKALNRSTALEYVHIAKNAGLDGVDFEANVSVVTKDVVQLAHAQGLVLGVWVLKALPTSDTAESVEEFERIGVDFFTSDLPPDVQAIIGVPDARVSGIP